MIIRCVYSLCIFVVFARFVYPLFLLVVSIRCFPSLVVFVDFYSLVSFVGVCSLFLIGVCFRWFYSLFLFVRRIYSLFIFVVSIRSMFIDVC